MSTATNTALNAHVSLSHGAGGSAFTELMRDVILPALGNEHLAALTDGTVLPGVAGQLVMTTDAHVVTPLFFNGGSIGSLAFCGSVNDLAVMGATPLYLTVSLIIEAGLELEILRRALDDLGNLAAKHRIPVVAGDTKVVERGKADRLFITTAGVGVIPPGASALTPSRLAESSAILINGPIGDHGIAIMAERAGFEFDAPVASDCAPLHGLTRNLIAACSGVQCMRDPTRGGVAAALNELSTASGLAMELFEETLPIRQPVRAAAELFGIDPLQLPNEGKVLVFVPKAEAKAALAAMHADPLGRGAAIIGEVRRDELALVTLRTSLGGRRLVPQPVGEQLPRIC